MSEAPVHARIGAILPDLRFAGNYWTGSRHA